MDYKRMTLLSSLLMWNLVINSQTFSIEGTFIRRERTEKVDAIETNWKKIQSDKRSSSTEQVITGMGRLGSPDNFEHDLQSKLQNHNQKLIENDFATKGIVQSGKFLNHIKNRERRADPEPEGTSEPETTSSSPEGTSEPEGSRSEPENNPNSTSEPEPESEMWPEPEPDWITAIVKWKAAWPIHVYGFATVLTVLGTVSLLELIQIHVRSRRKTALKVSLLLMIVIFCWTRAIALYINPYGCNTNINPIVVRLLFSIGHPCVISAMSLLLLVLIDTTKMNVAPPTFQRVQIIIIVVIFHVILVLVTDIVVAFYVETKVLILICQIYYLLMGLMLTIGYARVGWKIAKNSSASIVRDRKMEKLKILIAIASVTGFLMVVITIYGAAGVFGIYSDAQVVEAWPWWWFQTVGRTLEVVMVIILLFMNINVSGSRGGIRELFRNCKKKVFQNKVESEKSRRPSSVVVVTNSWLAPSVA